MKDSDRDDSKPIRFKLKHIQKLSQVRWEDIPRGLYAEDVAIEDDLVSNPGVDNQDPDT